MFVMKYCHQQQMSKCVAGSCCYFCVNEHKSERAGGDGVEGERGPGDALLICSKAI